VVGRIGKQLKVEVIVDREAPNQGEFQAQGWIRSLNRLFNGQLEDILGEIVIASGKRLVEIGYSHG